MARDNLTILWLLATHAGFIIALTLILGAPPFDPRKADQRRKSLFDLPAEIRNRIYDNLTIPSRTSPGSRSKFSPSPVHATYASATPDTLTADSTANREATPILYGANKFTFDNPTDATSFLAQFVHSIDLIQQLEILPGFADEIVAGDYSAYIPAFKYAISLCPSIVQDDDYLGVWEIAMSFQELFEEGNRDFTKEDVWARVESRLDLQRRVLPSTKSRIQEMLA